MRTRSRSIFPAFIHLVLLLGGICYFAPEGATGQANNHQCPRPSTGLGNPCESTNPFVMHGTEPAINIGAGNPVHLATGNKYLEVVDFPRQNNGLLFVRSYNAMDTTDTGLGVGWRHNFDISLRRTSGGLQITQADGSLIRFGKRLATTFPARNPAYGRLQVTATGWLWHWPGGNTITFDSSGLLTALVIDGQRLQVQRYSRASVFADRIRKVTSDNDQALVFRYRDIPGKVSANGSSNAPGTRLSEVETPEGPIRYAYDSLAGRLVSVSHVDGRVTQYLYEPAYQGGDPAKLTGIAVATHTIANIRGQQESGRQMKRLRTWQYDDRGRVIRAVLHDHPPGLGIQLVRYAANASNGLRGVTQVTDGAGNRTRFVWRRLHERYLLESVNGYGCLGCPAPGLKATYDRHGRLSTINGTDMTRHPNGALSRIRVHNGFWPRLQLEYDTRGLLRSWRSSLTGEQTLQYNAVGQPVAQHFANGTQWKYRYDSRQRLSAVVESAAPVMAPRVTHAARPAAAIARSNHLSHLNHSNPSTPPSPTGRTDRTGGPHLQPIIMTTVDYAENGTVTLTHPNETRSRLVNPANGMLHIGVNRPATADNPYPVRYQDVIQRDPYTGQLIQLLPEGGRLLYTYAPNDLLLDIVWEDAMHRRHPVLTTVGPGRVAYGNQIQTQYQRDPAGRQQMHVMALSDTERRPILGLERFVDPGGRILSETHYFPTQASALRRTYFYGKHQRLAGMIEHRYRYPDRQLSHPPVDAGKRRVWYAWDETGAGLAQFDGARTHRSRITRDASGLPRQVGALQAHYGVNHRLASVYRQDRRLLQNLHNGVGQRIARRDDLAFTQFYFLDNRIVGEWSVQNGAPLRVPASGAISRRYIYAGHVPVAFIQYPTPAAFADRKGPYFTPDGDAAGLSALRRQLTGRQSGSLYFIHPDTQGLPLAVTDSQAQIVWLGQPEPGGKIKPVIERLPMALRYPGQYQDNATGWFDNGYRSYDPAFGHYLEPDPLGPVPGNDPLGYAAAQPRRYIDPLGLLLFAFDGTLNQGSETRSNVFRLQKLYKGPVHYVGGPGTADGLSALAEPAMYGVSNPLQSPYVMGPLGVILSPMDAALGESTGDLVRMQMHHLLATLLDDAPSLKANNGHIPIDIIGFSRGATAARIFANALMAQTRHGLFQAQVYAPWLSHDHAMSTPVTINACLDFRFMGLFDTVAQLGLLGSNNAAYDYRVSSAWSWVAHAVALNEYNDLFPLTPIGIDNGTNFREVGFIGNHSDIGGSLQKADATDVANATGLPGDLGNVTLQWMHQQARLAGVPLEPLPQNALRIRNPLVHNSLMQYTQQDPASRHLALDRAVQMPGQASRPQHQLAALGQSKRIQVEPFIDRDLPRTRPLSVPDLFYGSMMAVPPGKEIRLVNRPIVGRTDLRAYARWLRETIGLSLETGEIW